MLQGKDVTELTDFDLTVTAAGNKLTSAVIGEIILTMLLLVHLLLTALLRWKYHTLDY